MTKERVIKATKEQMREWTRRHGPGFETVIVSIDGGPLQIMPEVEAFNLISCGDKVEYNTGEEADVQSFNLKRNVTLGEARMAGSDFRGLPLHQAADPWE